jgi:hypothetical protein
MINIHAALASKKLRASKKSQALNEVNADSTDYILVPVHLYTKMFDLTYVENENNPLLSHLRSTVIIDVVTNVELKLVVDDEIVTLKELADIRKIPTQILWVYMAME